MHETNPATWEHGHSFGLDRRRTGERRTLIVALLTAVTMVVEIVAGIAFGSMALLADGLHMASHSVALGLALFAYIYCRRHAGDPRFAFGTGKVNSLGGYTSALLLAGFAIYMVVESVSRLMTPVPIVFDAAIAVAVIGLIVNGVSVLILDVRHHEPDADAHRHGPALHAHDHGHGRGRGHGHGHSHGHGHGRGDGHSHGRGHGRGDGHGHGHGHGRARGHQDHNLHGAYLHVLADALTSLLAIVALLAGKYLGAVWMDPAMGIVGAILVGRWAYGLLRDSGHTLLDRQAPAEVRDGIRRSVERFRDTRVVDLHVWSIGPSLFAAELAVVSHEPEEPSVYKELLSGAGLAHVTVEVHRCPGDHGS